MQKLYSILLFFLTFFCVTSNALADQNYFDELIRVYDLYGQESYMIQEDITQIAHILQAAHLAKISGAPEEVIVGLLLHDVGQIINQNHVGDTNYLHSHHDDLGAEWVKNQGFGQLVVDLVQFHTLTKVILCEQEKDYFDNLSQASKISYEIQNSKYKKKESIQKVEYLKKHKQLNSLLAARRCDEMAKIRGLDAQTQKNGQYVLSNLKSYREMVERVRQGLGKPARQPQWQNNIKCLYNKMKTDRIAFENTLNSLQNIDFAVECQLSHSTT